MVNNFANDSRIVSVYNFEPGALEADSKGTNGLYPYGPVSETTIKKQGGGSVKLISANTTYFTQVDASLSANFPLKNGDNVATGTWCFWVRLITGTNEPGTLVTQGSVL